LLGTRPFVAIDFETAAHQRESACAVALARVERGRVVAVEHRLIRPPERVFRFSHIHGLTWEDVADAPAFRTTWLELAPLFEGAAFFAAHNAPFDRTVLHACCQRARLRPPSLPFHCTMWLARQVWGLYPTTLPHVCDYLEIPLDHHDAESDARACARIVIEARRASR